MVFKLSKNTSLGSGSPNSAHMHLQELVLCIACPSLQKLQIVGGVFGFVKIEADSLEISSINWKVSHIVTI